MAIDSDLYRQVMRRFATGVAVLTVRDGDKIHGMTANTLTSVSLNPTLVLVCILKGSTTHDFVSRGGNFAMNILSDERRGWAERFAKQVPVPADPFADIPYHRAVTGAPIFDDCMAYADCRVVAAYDGGTHTIFLGEVDAAGFGSARGKALLRFGGEYTALG